MFSYFFVFGIGELASFIAGSVYLFNALEMAQDTFPIALVIVSLIIVLPILFAFFYLAFRTVRMKKDKDGMALLFGKTGEVIRLIDNPIKGASGWLVTNGENWKFKSRDNLKKSDIVKIIDYKGMTLIVEKSEEV